MVLVEANEWLYEKGAWFKVVEWQRYWAKRDGRVIYFTAWVIELWFEELEGLRADKEVEKLVENGELV